MLASPIDRLIERLAREPVLLVTVESTQGSAPREPGTWMAVFADGDSVGSIGGGQLEFEAMAIARRALAGDVTPPTRRCALGPSLGQCCGGVVHLRFEHWPSAQLPALRARLEAAETSRMPVALFGGGHVGRAIVQALAPLPVRVHWIDSRDEVFPTDLPRWVVTDHSAPIEAAVSGLVPGSRVLVMSFSHAEDLDVVAACLRRRRENADLPFVGLIGSRSKWAGFRHRLEARGYTEAELDAVTSPIGVAGVVGKEPAVIAAAVAAQLMQQR